MPLPTEALAAIQRRYDASKAECKRQTDLARHYRAALVELAEASKGFMGCQNPMGADRDGEWSPCAACYGCRLEAAVQRAEQATRSGCPTCKTDLQKWRADCSDPWHVASGSTNPAAPSTAVVVTLDSDHAAPCQEGALMGECLSCQVASTAAALGTEAETIREQERLLDRMASAQVVLAIREHAPCEREHTRLRRELAAARDEISRLRRAKSA